MFGTSFQKRPVSDDSSDDDGENVSLMDTIKSNLVGLVLALLLWKFYLF